VEFIELAFLNLSGGRSFFDGCFFDSLGGTLTELAGAEF
jgi:hypothetical protein